MVKKRVGRLPRTRFGTKFRILERNKWWGNNNQEVPSGLMEQPDRLPFWDTAATHRMAGGPALTTFLCDRPEKVATAVRILFNASVNNVFGCDAEHFSFSEMELRYMTRGWNNSQPTSGRLIIGLGSQMCPMVFFGSWDQGPMRDQ